MRRFHQHGDEGCLLTWARRVRPVARRNLDVGGIISVYNYTVMDKPVKDHIRRLEWKIEALTEEVMRNRLDQSERNHIEAEIRAANLALSHYKSALEIEQRLELSN